jgi:hypothetical protein
MNPTAHYAGQQQNDTGDHHENAQNGLAVYDGLDAAECVDDQPGAAR